MRLGFAMRFSLGSLFKFCVRVRLLAILAVERMIRFTILRDRRVYYLPFYGTDNPVALLIKNVLRPQRFLTRLFYNQVVRLPTFLSKSRALPSRVLAPGTSQAVAQLRQDGILILPGFFAAEAKNLASRYKLTADN